MFWCDKPTQILSGSDSIGASASSHLVIIIFAGSHRIQTLDTMLTAAYGTSRPSISGPFALDLEPLPEPDARASNCLQFLREECQKWTTIALRLCGRPGGCTLADETLTISMCIFLSFTLSCQWLLTLGFLPTGKGRTLTPPAVRIAVINSQVLNTALRHRCHGFQDIGPSAYQPS